jgi:hypothetical protein
MILNSAVFQQKYIQSKKIETKNAPHIGHI